MAGCLKHIGTHENACFIILGDMLESPADSDYKAAPYPVLD